MCWAGGLGAALVGPQLNKLMADAYVIPFLGTYLTVVALNILGTGLFFFLRFGTASDTTHATALSPPRSRRQILSDPTLIVDNDLRYGRLCADDAGDDIHPPRRCRLRVCEW